MIELTTPLPFISDPGHGWLRVPLSDIVALGIESDISPYSFIDRKFAYLEEDDDCAVFVQACKAKNIPMPTIKEKYVEYFNRNRPSFGDPQFSSSFWNKLRS